MIANDNAKMFCCSKCGKYRDESLRERDRAHCKVCEAHRSNQKTLSPNSYEENERLFFKRRDLEARGVKICAICKEERPVSEFHKHRAGRCQECGSKEILFQKRRARKKKADAQGRVFVPRHCGPMQKHDAHVLAMRRHFSAECKRIARLFESLERPWKAFKADSAEYYRLRYSADVEFQLKERMRRQMNKSAKRDGVAELIRGALRRNGSSGTAERMLGYSMADLRRHLEAQFLPGMSWDEFMQGRIHIDHIKPQAAFNMADDAQWRECWALPNLRPMWARDNLAKSDRLPCGRLARHVRAA